MAEASNCLNIQIPTLMDVFVITVLKLAAYQVRIFAVLDAQARTVDGAGVGEPIRDSG